MIPETPRRVEKTTPEQAQKRICRMTEHSLAHYARRLDAIESRLRELNREWDMERTLQTNAAAVAMAGLALGAFVDRRWLAVPAAVSFFLLQHALQGWCPPVSFFRRMVVRTQREIDQEIYALKALRGDFKNAHVSNDDGDAQEAAMRALQAALA